MKFGVDVSYHQKTIDWSELSKHIDWCMIRIGYRGYTSGNIHLDEQFENNLNGAEKYNIPHGFYFYNSCISSKEAIEEANFVIDSLKGREAQMPICFDFEGFNDKNKRVYQTTIEQRTSYQELFNNIMIENGYNVMTYGSSGLIKTKYDLSKSDMPIWCARYHGGYKTIDSDLKYRPTIAPYTDRIAIWQYTSIGKIDGIDGNVDMNFMIDESILENKQELEKIDNMTSNIVEYTKGVDDNIQISKNFKAGEFKCPCSRCKTYLVDVDYVKNMLQPLRDWSGKSISINSGYRCQKHNAEVGGASASNHMKGIAFDLHVYGKTPDEVAERLEIQKSKGIIKYKTFVHTDNVINKRYGNLESGTYVSVSSFLKSKNPYMIPTYTLTIFKRWFQSKTYVKWLQFELKELGFYTGVIDGDFWVKTRDAVKAYQLSKGLVKDGKVGKNTRTSLLG